MLNFDTQYFCFPERLATAGGRDELTEPATIKEVRISVRGLG